GHHHRPAERRSAGGALGPPRARRRPGLRRSGSRRGRGSRSRRPLRRPRLQRAGATGTRHVPRSGRGHTHLERGRFRSAFQPPGGSVRGARTPPRARHRPRRGIDIENALLHGAARVDGVEVNRSVVELMNGQFASSGGEVYSRPGVRVYEDEARSFVRRSVDRYDLIAMTVVDSYTALANGSFAVSESYLYTDEA